MLVFLLTDIDEDLKRADPRPAGSEVALYQYHTLVENCVVQYGADGVQHKDTRVFAVLEPEDALRCAMEIVRKAKSISNEFDISPHLCVALHAGDAHHIGEEYFGVDKDRSWKLIEAARGRHILLSEATARILKLPPGSRLRSLGVHLLKDLFEPQELFALTVTDVEYDEIALPRSLSSYKHNMEPQFTPFFGRHRELEEIGALLNDPSCRLISMLAPGGFGKSRLAMQVAADHIERFPDGVYFISLGTVRTEEQLLFNIAEGMKLAFYGTGEPKEQLFDFLREKEMLLVLDNFEQIIAGSSFVQDVLKAAPRLRLLITSRQRLRISEEKVYEVKGLELPKELSDKGLERYDAIQLFVMSAQRVKPDFDPSQAELIRAFGICRLLQGMPLGIELAAARVTNHSLSEIHRQIETNQEAMATGPTYIPERHRSLRAVFEYSWSLLKEPRQRLLMALSVFRSAFSSEAALHVARAKPADLEYLADQSLLIEKEGRYQFHEIVQYYSKEKLYDQGLERKAAEEDHARYFAEFVDKRLHLSSARSQKQMLDEIATVIEDIQSAWNWALENGRAEQVGLISDGLRMFYEVRGFYRDGRTAFQKAAEHLSQKGVWPRDLKLYARALFSAGYFAQKMALDVEATRYFMQSLDASKLHPSMKTEMGYASLGLGLVAEDRGDFKIAQGHLNVALSFFEKSREKPGKAWAHGTLARMAIFTGNVKGSEALAHKGLELFTKLNDTRGVAWAQILLGDVALKQNRYVDAKSHYQKGLAGYIEFGDRGGIAWSFVNLGNISMTMGEYNGAHQLYREAQIIDRELGDRRGLAWTFYLLGKVAMARGDYDEAEKEFRESLTLYREVGDKQGTEWALGVLGDIACFNNDADGAERLYQESEETYLEDSTNPQRGWRDFHHGIVAQMRGDIDEAVRRIEKSAEAFQKSDDGHGYAAALSQLGKIHFDQKQYRASEKCLKQALSMMLQAHHHHRALDYMMALARILSLKGEKDLVYRIMTFAYGHTSLWQVDREKYREFYTWVQDNTPEDIVLKVLEGSESLTLEGLASTILVEPALEVVKVHPVRKAKKKARTVKTRVSSKKRLRSPRPPQKNKPRRPK